MRQSGLAPVLLGGGLLVLLAACTEDWRPARPSAISDLRGHWLLLHYGVEGEVGRWELSFSGGNTSVGAAFATQPNTPHCFGRYSRNGRSVRFMLCDREYSGEILAPDKIVGSFVGQAGPGTWAALSYPE